MFILYRRRIENRKEEGHGSGEPYYMPLKPA
jgi:hypothetical protein